MIVSLDNSERKKFFLIIFLDDGFPLPNQWNIVHSIALNEDAQLLCGADRQNYRIQCFNSNTGEFQRQIRVEAKDNIGPIYAIEFAPNTNGLSEKKNHN
jgi:peptidylamidoglycolate lyase